MRIELCLWSYESGRWLKGRRWLENGKGGLFELAKRGGGVILLSRGIGRNLIHGSLWRTGYWRECVTRKIIEYDTNLV